MAEPSGQQSVAPEPENVSLPHKPSARVAVKWYPAQNNKASLSSMDTLIVFLNGLMTTMPTWNDTIDQFTKSLSPDHSVSLLCYDRYGQGATTDRDPTDSETEDPSHGHNVMSAVEDLQYLISHFTGHQPVKTQPSTSSPGPKLILVANSIGCAIARLFAQTYPGTVAGLLLLDSVIANTNFIEIFPDPESPSFDLSEQVPKGVTVEDLVKIRAITMKIFHPSVGSREGLTRKDLKTLLPSSDGPKLVGWPDGGSDAESSNSTAKGPYLTVIGHGFEKFIQESQMMGMPAAAVSAYSNPYWWRYNEGLCKTSDADRVKGPIEAVGAGHFIQRDRPDLVAGELEVMVGKVAMLESGHN